MILRVLVLIFAFNAFVPSALAMGFTGNCMEMEGTNSEMIMSHTDSESKMGMNCEMSEMDKSCSDTLCASGCLTSITSFVSYDFSPSFPLPTIEQPKSDLAYFYKIYPVINTPPPLV